MARGHPHWHWLDSYTHMLDLATTEGLPPDPLADPRGGGGVPAWIVHHRRLRLWWD